MAIDITLTWKNKDGEEVVEECQLVSEYDVIYTLDGEPVVADVLDILGDAGFVVFEDEDGMFMLKPEQIVLIEGVD